MSAAPSSATSGLNEIPPLRHPEPMIRCLLLYKNTTLQSTGATCLQGLLPAVLYVKELFRFIHAAFGSFGATSPKLSPFDLTSSS